MSVKRIRNPVRPGAIGTAPPVAAEAGCWAGCWLGAGCWAGCWAAVQADLDTAIRQIEALQCAVLEPECPPEDPC